MYQIRYHNRYLSNLYGCTIDLLSRVIGAVHSGLAMRGPPAVLTQSIQRSPRKIQPHAGAMHMCGCCTGSRSWLAIALADLGTSDQWRRA